MTIVKVGSVSTGTMRVQDLVPAFVAELKTLLRGELPEDVINQYREFKASPGSESSYDFLQELFDRLDELAPDGYYFGSHPNDGADFGFWTLE